MRKIAAVVLVYNGEKFIKPHLDMLMKQIDRIVVVIPKKPFKGYVKYLGLTPDKTAEIVSKYPVEILSYDFVEGDAARNFPDAYNFGLKKVRNYDIATVIDVEMLLTDEDFKKFIDFIKETDAEYYSLDHSKYSPDYHLDWDMDHGLMDQVENIPIAMNPQREMLLYRKIDAKALPIEGIVFHHFRNWKSDIIPKGDFISAPQEIKDKMFEWKKQLYA